MKYIASLFFALGILVYWMTTGKYTKRFNLPGMFIAFNSILFLGTAYLVDPSAPEDVIYLYSICLALWFFLGTLFFAKSLFSVGQIVEREWEAEDLVISDDVSFNRKLLAMTAFSVAVSVLYYIAVGYNLFLLALVYALKGRVGELDTASLRLAAYAGDRYLAPGYVNQFKNTILPCLTIFVLGRYLLLKKKWDLVYLILVAPVAFVCLLGTGQRGAFVLSFLVAWIYLGLILPKSQSQRIRKIVLVGGFIFMMLSTFFLGRSRISGNESVGIVVIADEIFRRVFVDNQMGAIIGFRYIYHLPIQFGGEWIQSLLGIIPGAGFHGSTLSNQIFEIMYGSDRGTAPLSIWGSIWYNWGLIGIPLFSILLAIFYTYLRWIFFFGPKSAIRILIYTQLLVILGTWIADGPMTLMNEGFVGVLILMILFRGSVKKGLMA